MNSLSKVATRVAAGLACAALISPAMAGEDSPFCGGLPSHGELKAALSAAISAANAGIIVNKLPLNMWGSVVNRDGVVCAVAFTGSDRGAQWPGSRVISAQKAYTANAFSLPGLALATANIYRAVQPGGSLYGLQFSNPVDTEDAYRGPAQRFGKPNDPMVGRRVGGVNVFGGGLALYNSNKQLVGAIGVSGDTSCTDHAVAWRSRSSLNLDYVPAGVGPGGVDQISYDGGPWSQPNCLPGNEAAEQAAVNSLPATRK